MRLGPGTAYQPDLASSWSTDETGKTWTFTIRDDAVWHDGEPVTADDVVFTIDALKSPDAAGAGAAAWADVTVEAVDEKTVRLTLGTPIGGVLAAATQPLLPAHLLADVPFADLATSDFARLPVGSGPFAITDVDDQRATLVPASGVMTPVEEDPAASAGAAPSMDSLATPLPRPSASLPSPYLDEVEVRFYDDEAALAEGLRSGEVDAASGLSGARLGELAQEEGIDRHAYPTTTLSTVLLNLRPGHKELRDPKVRAAMLAAIDRDALVSEVLGGNATRADGLVPPTSWAYDAASVGSVKHDPKAAAKAMQAAGWSKKGGKWVAPGGKGAYRLELLTVSPAANPRLASVADFVRDSWKTFGFDVTPRRGRGRDLATRLRSGDFTAAVVDIAEGLEPDLYPLLATSQVRASGIEPRRLPGPGPGPPPGGRAQAGNAGGARGRVEGPARRPGDPAAPPAPRVERRSDARARPRRGHPAAHRGHRRPLLGCASMAPRRGPVSPRVGRFHGRAEVAEW